VPELSFLASTPQKMLSQARRGNARYRVPPTQVKASQAHFSKIVEVPDTAQNVQCHTEKLPQQYRSTLQEVR
jgi:hypothetical protein